MRISLTADSENLEGSRQLRKVFECEVRNGHLVAYHEVSPKFASIHESGRLVTSFPWTGKDLAAFRCGLSHLYFRAITTGKLRSDSQRRAAISDFLRSFAVGDPCRSVRKALTPTLSTPVTQSYCFAVLPLTWSKDSVLADAAAESS